MLSYAFYISYSFHLFIIFFFNTLAMRSQIFHSTLIKNDHRKNVHFLQLSPLLSDTQNDQSDFTKLFHRRQLSQKYNLDQSINNVVKYIIYLYSPDVDIVDHIDQNFRYYDKFVKIKAVIEQLIFHYGFGIDDKDDKIRDLQDQNNQICLEKQQMIKNIANEQNKNKKLKEEISSLKHVIIQLGKAYQQAKNCYEQEILQYKCEVNQLKANLKYHEQKYGRQFLVIPETPLKPQFSKYTDRSMYQRFSSKNSFEHQQAQVNNSLNNQKQIQNLKYQNECLMQEQQKYEKCLKDIEIQMIKIKRQFKQLSDENQQIKLEYQNSQKRILELINLVQERNESLAKKNRTINQLLDVINSK